MRRRWNVLFVAQIALIALMALPRVAEASLFCTAVPGMQPECIYDDASECRQRASQLGGICDINPAEMTLKPGYGQFCLVSSDRSVQCVFSDRSSCESEAQRDGSTICVENNLTGVLNGPYRYVPQRQY